MIKIRKVQIKTKERIKSKLLLIRYYLIFKARFLKKDYIARMKNKVFIFINKLINLYISVLLKKKLVGID